MAGGFGGEGGFLQKLLSAPQAGFAAGAILPHEGAGRGRPSRHLAASC